MNELLKEIPYRILELAKGALAQANMHSTFFDPGNEHWDFVSVLNTAHAGELFLKASIAKEHPLLIFKDLFGFDDGQCWFPRGTEPVFPPRSEPPLSMVF